VEGLQVSTWGLSCTVVVIGWVPSQLVTWTPFRSLECGGTQLLASINFE
jgi:hypothetical protein